MALIQYQGDINQLIDKQPDKLVDINEFITEIKFDIDKLYVDTFWNSLDKTEWIYLSNDLINMIGFKGIKPKDRMGTCMRLLRKFATEDEDFKIIE